MFAQVRALEPPADLRSAHERLIEGIDRYDEVAGDRLTAAGLLDRGELHQGLAIWKNAQSLEDEAHPLVAEAGRRIQAN